MPRTQAEADFEALLGRLSHDEPRFGWSDVKQLPELTDADLGVILAAEPALLLDSLDDETARSVAGYMQRDELSLYRFARIGALMIVTMRYRAQRHLLRELRIYCERLNANGVEQHGCVTAAEASAPR